MRRSRRFAAPRSALRRNETCRNTLVHFGIDLKTSPLYTLPNNTRHASACKRTLAGFLLPMKFTKPATDLDAQIALLRSRGMIISDEARAKHYLRFIGYYRLSGYSLPFQINYNTDGSHRWTTGRANASARLWTLRMPHWGLTFEVMRTQRRHGRRSNTTLRAAVGARVDRGVSPLGDRRWNERSTL